MNIYKKIGIFLFIVSAILVVFSGAFKFSPQMESFSKAFLIFSGIIVGVMNISEEEKIGFIVASAGLLLSFAVLSIVLNTSSSLIPLDIMMRNTSLFIASSVAIVALKIIVDYASSKEDLSIEEKMKMMEKELSMLEESKALRVWNFLIFLAVCLVFFIILFDIFFISTPYKKIINIIEIIISIFFIADLFVLYKKYVMFSTFLKKCWPDIIAAIPLYGFFRVAKILRFIKFSRIPRSLKFFSQESGVNKYVSKIPKPKGEEERVHHHLITDKKKKR